MATYIEVMNDGNTATTEHNMSNADACAAIRDMMNVWNQAMAIALETNPEMTDEERYQMVAAAMESKIKAVK